MSSGRLGRRRRQPSDAEMTEEREAQATQIIERTRRHLKTAQELLERSRESHHGTACSMPSLSLRPCPQTSDADSARMTPPVAFDVVGLRDHIHVTIVKDDSTARWQIHFAGQHGAAGGFESPEAALRALAEQFR